MKQRTSPNEGPHPVGGQNVEKIAGNARQSALAIAAIAAVVGISGSLALSKIFPNNADRGKNLLTAASEGLIGEDLTFTTSPIRGIPGLATIEISGKVYNVMSAGQGSFFVSPKDVVLKPRNDLSGTQCLTMDGDRSTKLEEIDCPEYIY